MNFLGPKNVDESGQRTAFERCPTATPSRTAIVANSGILPWAELGPSSLELSGPSLLARARRWAAMSLDRA